MGILFTGRCGRIDGEGCQMIGERIHMGNELGGASVGAQTENTAEIKAYFSAGNV